MLRLRLRDLVRRHLGIDVRRVHVRGSTGLVGSNFDEQTVIERYLEQHPGVRRWFVDIGAADGEVSSNTAFLARDGWEGVAVEMDGDEFARLARATARAPRVALARTKVEPATVVPLLQGLGVPHDPGFVSLDIDGYDHEVMAALLGAFRPALLCTEVNEKIPPPLRFHVRHSPGYRWRDDHFYGHSLASAHELAAAHGYALVALEYNNAFFAPTADVAEPLGVDQAYRQGYLERPDRLARLPWNRDVEHLQGLEPAAAVAEVARLFAGREDEFTLDAGAADAPGAAPAGAPPPPAPDPAR